MRVLVLLLSVFVSQAQAPRQAPFATPLAPADVKDQPAVVEKPTTTVEILHARVTKADR